MKAFFEKFAWENEAETIATYYFWPEQSYSYLAGQYADFSLPHDHDNRGEVRTMTLSSSPDESLISFTTRINPSASSFKKALDALQPGTEITVFEAMGDLVLPIDRSIPLVFVAGGLGIASFVGMIKWLIARHEQRNITVLYGFRSPKDIIMLQPYQEYATKFGLKLELYASDGSESFGSLALTPRRLQAHDVVRYTSANSLIYLSGTETMVEHLRKELQSKHGVPGSQIIFDYFSGY